MSSTQFIVITKSKPGAEAEFNKWYDEVHLRDVVAVPGVVRAKRFRVFSQEPTAFESPIWNSVALYEIDAEDPQSVFAGINASMVSGNMFISDAIDAENTLLMFAESTREVEKQV